MEMVERVARAIFARVPAGYGMTMDEAREYARDAIGAMLEPTSRMIDKGDNMMPQLVPEPDDPLLTGADVARDVWQAMIAAALTPSASSPSPDELVDEGE